MKGVAALRDDVGFLSRQSKTERQGFVTDRAELVVGGIVGDDWHRSRWVRSVRVVRRRVRSVRLRRAVVRDGGVPVDGGLVEAGGGHVDVRMRF